MPPLRESIPTPPPTPEGDEKANSRPRATSRGARIALRVLAGFFGLAGLAVFVFAKEWDFGVIVTMGAFCGLTLGFAFGGDKWGARLFGLFTGIRVEGSEKPKADPSAQDQ
jgi:hypothetical protein